MRLELLALRLHPSCDEPRRLLAVRIVRQLVCRRVVQLERAQARALKCRAEAHLDDTVLVGHEPVVGLGEELAAVVRSLDVRDEEHAAGLEEGGEEARRVVDRGEVVGRRAALHGKGGNGRDVKGRDV